MPPAVFCKTVFAGALMGLMLAFPAVCAHSALDALSLFAAGVLPSLLPFSICALLFVSGKTLPGGALVLLSWLGGSPTGARLFQDATLSPAQARRYAAMSGVISPMFFLSTLAQWLGSARGAALVWLSHLLAAALCGGLMPPTRGDTRARLPAVSVAQAITQGAQAMLTVGACIALGAAASALFSRLLPHLPALPLALAQAALEVTGGCRALIRLPLSPRLLLPLLSLCTAFNGGAILLQNAAFWQKRGLTLAHLLPLALLRGALAFLACFLLMNCLPSLFAV